MRLIDFYFRAFNAYKNVSQVHNQAEKDRSIIMHAQSKDDILTAIKFDCEIDPEWVLNIEEGLKFVEKAIAEDRQFIRTEGNVVEIEKVKKTSKATVEHLARHSNLITRVPKDKDNLIPDKLYIVEKLSDYTVYENRFLYMLLRYLKDFIQMRLDKIKDKVTTYESFLSINKDIKTNNAHIKYNLDYNATFKNDTYLMDRYKEIPLISKVETIYALVNAFLATPLMKEVSKAPMIKPPIVKTNVLLMNQNFRAAVALYEFVRSYNKEGYTFNEVLRKINPFSNDLASDMAHIIELTGTVSYTFGQDIKHILLEKLNHEEKLIKEREKLKIQNELKRQKKILEDLNEDPRSYILRLEKYQLDLERENHALQLENEKIPFLEKSLQISNKNEEMLKNEKELLNSTIKEHIKKEELFKQKYTEDFKNVEILHQEELDVLRTSLNNQISALISAHAEEISDLKINHQKTLEIQKEAYDEQILNIKFQHEKLVESVKLDYEEKMANLDLRIHSLLDDLSEIKNEFTLTIKNHEDIVKEYQDKIDVLSNEITILNDDKHSMQARYIALKEQQGLTTNEELFTSKERFEHLEKEMKAYKKFFKRQWNLTKQQIKHKVKEEINATEASDKSTKEK